VSGNGGGAQAAFGDPHLAAFGPLVTLPGTLL